MTGQSVPWYRKKYRGGKAEALWQLSFAVSATLALVILPASVEYVMLSQKMKHFSVNEKPKQESNNDMRKMIYERRMALRKYLDEKQD